MSGAAGRPALTRRALLAGALAPLPGCQPAAAVSGALHGADAVRGHRLRQQQAWGPPARSRRVRVVIAGAGVAGLAAARALRQRGIDDFALLELEDSAGGNSRGGAVAGIACPLGAHYLPLPGDAAREVQDLLEEAGLRQRRAGRWVYDERHLCHAPQERLFFRGQWQEGLLPTQDVGASTLAQYRRLALLIQQAGQAAGFRIPAGAPAPAHRALDGITFAHWLDRAGLSDPHLRWYLDYCCRDDYGAGAATVSAWAGVHYFASRHGFQAPGAQTADPEPVLTWPEGNGWLTRWLAQGLGDRLRPGQLVTRIVSSRHGVAIDAWNEQRQSLDRWQCERCIVALPVFIAARVIEQPPEVLRQRAGRIRYAPWAVVNLHLRRPLADRPGAPPSWDNVVYGAQELGYVDAQHQSLDPRPGPTVLSWYCAPGEAARQTLLSRSWQDWGAAALAEFAQPHPDLGAALTRVEVARYGHAMAIPVPGARSQPGAPQAGRLAFAHSDWAGYSVFEEAFTAGHRAATGI